MDMRFDPNGADLSAGGTITRRSATSILQAVLLVVMLAASLLAVQVAVADEAGAHDAYSNGCTIVPDSGAYFNFHAACDAHDYCYAFKYYGDSYNGRLTCDQIFRDDMRAYCNSTYSWSWWRRSICRGVANTYYTGVRTFGGAFF